MILERIWPSAITDEDVKWLTIGCEQCKWNKLTPAQVVQQVLDGDTMLYRIHGNATGIVALSVNAQQEQMWIDLFAGKGLMKAQEEFRTMLRMMAQGLGLKRLAGFVSRRALAKWYDEHTAGKPTATLYVEEIV